MGTKKFKTGLAAAVLCLGICSGLTGCGENVIPELTESDIQTIGEYSAFILMKYDASNRSRLVTLPPETTPVEAEQTEPEMPPETEEPSGMGPVDDTPVTDVSREEDPGSMEDVLRLAEGVRVSYAGAELCDTYPHNEEIWEVVVNASSETKKLLVLRFCFSNETEQEQIVDIASQKDLTFRITVNEDYRCNAMMTLLLDDMMTFKESISAGESAEAVLIIEVEQKRMEDIVSISLNLKNDEKAYTIRLK